MISVCKMPESQKVPWREGFWKMGNVKDTILQTSGYRFQYKSLLVLDHPELADLMPEEQRTDGFDCKFGNFGRAREEIISATGMEDYNIDLASPMINYKGVLNEEGTKITVWGLTNKLVNFVWMDEASLEQLKENRDPYDAPR